MRVHAAPRYPVVLFDLDGTLTDPRLGITRSVQHALESLGIVESDPDRLLPFIGPPLLESFQRTYGLSVPEALRAIDAYREYFSRTGIFENAVYPGIEGLLQSLADHGVRLFVATSKPEVFADRILEHFRLRGFFSRVVGTPLDHNTVSKADVVASVLADLPPTLRRGAVLVGDREHDVLGARANHIASIAVTYGYGSIEELRAAHPTHIVGSVRELAEHLLVRA